MLLTSEMALQPHPSTSLSSPFSFHCSQPLPTNGKKEKQKQNSNKGILRLCDEGQWMFICRENARSVSRYLCGGRSFLPEADRLPIVPLEGNLC